MSSSFPISVLDLGSVAGGSSTAETLADTTRLAQAADRLGYQRFWVAEHHNMPIVASTSPAVLIAHIAAMTERIRVGSGGVMLPNHPPLVVAEQFAILEALHPDRIDLGIGRAPGTDPATASALRRGTDTLDAQEFPRHLIDVMGLLGDVREGSSLHARFSATPRALSYPPVFLLGSSGYSAQLAGLLGLPFVQAHHFDMGGTDQSIRLYRQTFRPSDRMREPYPVVTANVVVAHSEDDAHRLSLPGRLVRFWLRTGRPIRLVTIEEAASHPDLEAALSMPTESLVGTPEQVAEGLDQLKIRTGAAELMVTATTAGYEEKIEGLGLLAKTIGIAPPGLTPDTL